MEGVINRLFEGHIQKSITCLNVPYKSTKRDAYMDVFLDVRGCKDIYDSFDRLTAKERMDGANQYNAEGYGLQVPACALSSVRNPMARAFLRLAMPAAAFPRAGYQPPGC